MSIDVNQCNFIGRLGRDPETRHTSSGDAICNFSIACGWKSKDKEGVEWVNITCFGRLADIAGEYLTKGKQVFVSGRFKTDKYEKDGVTRYATKIVADRIQLLGSKPEGEESPPPRNEKQTATAKKGGGFDEMDDNIPW